MGWGRGASGEAGGWGREQRPGCQPRRGRLERCHILPTPPDCSVALPRVWLMWPSSGDLEERQPESRGLETALAGGTQWTLLHREAQG